MRLYEKYIKRDCKKESGASGDCAVISHTTGKQKACYDNCGVATRAMNLEEVDDVQTGAQRFFDDNVVWEGPIEVDQKDKLIFILSKTLPQVNHLDLFNASEEQLMKLLQGIREKDHGI